LEKAGGRGGSPITFSLVALTREKTDNVVHPQLGHRSHQEVIYMFRSQKGQGLAEYALILALIALVVIGAVVALGGNISTIMNKVATGI
jgi:pilus assembly protein Flp/PilA